ncbi:hypothetical protein FA743_19570 [Paracoccus gahaiensis]|uniref:Uncharacterized protein n=1 Tax=Paracoccus gahaiensis TaxID=1706839 RepID=A0A4U0R485_9RHOB|nr:hypothetical protein [Paracoccus gahaiensis]TJZ88992.1 hypothetical protein FA743_19570 [Paracoccus gahaiensis]
MEKHRDTGRLSSTATWRPVSRSNNAKANEMRERPSLPPRRPLKGLGLALVASGLLAGCMSETGSLESAYAANLASETALNAQVMGDRARDQRCDRDPGRGECGRR